MATYHDGIIPFVYREDFNYLDYLKEQSHFDTVSFQIDDSVSRLIFSNEAIASGVMSSLSNLEAGLGDLANITQQGFEDVASRIDETNQHLISIFYAIEDGFAETTRQLGSINTILSQLLHVAKTPEQNWANERFSIAQDLFYKGLYSDALKTLDQGINGVDGKLGYGYDHRLHMLLGLIYLGSKKNIDPKVVNLLEAKQAFSDAAKYAVPSNEDQIIDMQRAKIEALQMAGWADYCLGDFSSSIENYKDATKIDDGNAKSWYYLAKVQYHLHDEENASESFRRSINIDPINSLKAGGDDDFMANKESVIIEIESVRKSYFASIKDITDTLEPYCEKNTAEAITRYSKGSYNHDVKEIDTINRLPKQTALVPLFEAKTSASEIKLRMSDTKQSVVQELKKKLEAIKNHHADSLRRHSNYEENTKEEVLHFIAIGLSSIFALGIFINAFFYADYTWLYKYIPKQFSGFTVFVISLVTAIFKGVLSLIITYPIAWIIRPLYTSWKRDENSKLSMEIRNNKSKQLEIDLTTLSKL